VIYNGNESAGASEITVDAAGNVYVSGVVGSPVGSPVEKTILRIFFLFK